MSFMTQYFDLIEGTGEKKVLCPFPHTNSVGEYKESNPSAYVNTDKNVFHCKSCNNKHGEASFISKMLGCSYTTAIGIQNSFKNFQNNIYEWKSYDFLEESKQLAKDLGISEEVLEQLNVRSGPKGTLAFPVLMYDILLDVRTYNPGGKPKIQSQKGATAGLIVPFDVWQSEKNNKVTLICAGEKDMAIARTNGFKAICLTGGEGASPTQLNYFKDKPVAILYDNDSAGIQGAKKLALELYKVTNKIQVCTGFHEVCKEKGEDLWDFFIKYGKTREDLITYLKATPKYEPSDSDKEEHNFKMLTLTEASRPKKLRTIVKSNVQVVSTSDATYAVPTGVSIRKVTQEAGQMEFGEVKTWEFNPAYPEHLFGLFEEGTPKQIKDNLLAKVGVAGEKGVKVSVLSKMTIYKASVTDLLDAEGDNNSATEFEAYSLDKLTPGEKYCVTHKIIDNSMKSNRLDMFIIHSEKADDAVSEFRVDEESKHHLQTVQNIEGTVEEKVNKIVEKAKGLIGYDGNNTLIKAIDFTYHSALSFDFGRHKGIKGCLDSIVVAESRVGKSSTASALRETYGLGAFTSLAGNSATIPGLVGGSNKLGNGAFQTRAGTIPQNHKGLCIFEEFGKCNSNIVRELTDIRSSSEVRITRVNGSLYMPAMLRMLSLSNTKVDSSGSTKPIDSYGNGIQIIQELVGAAEDIARYDIIAVLSDRGNSFIDPLWEPEEPFDREVYRTRIRWVWSRTPEQIVIETEAKRYLIDECNRLNKVYNCHIKIFGTEAWKKIARVAIAVAGYVVSTDNTYENIVVTKDHIKYAIEYLVSLYDNQAFRLAEYVANENKYNTLDEEGIQALQNVYDKVPGLVMQLESTSEASRHVLMSASGTNQDDLNAMLNTLTKACMIKYNEFNVLPTTRFRLAVNKINKKTHTNKVGERYVPSS